MSESPSVLVLTSSGCEPSVVTSVLAALQAVGAKLQAFDAGRLGGDKSGAVEWVMRALSGEIEERRLEREVETARPDAVICFEVGPALALCELRKKSARPFPVLAVVPELSPSAAWAQCEADRFFVSDDEAAVLLEDHGVPGHAILPVGSIGEFRYAQAGATSRESLKKRFGLENRVALVEVDGLGHAQSSQLALQLSLISSEVTYLFDAGRDTDAATALRSQVPILGMRAKLFGETPDAPLLWRCADVVIARPSGRAISRAAAVGAGMVCYSPRDGAETRRANALEERGRGQSAANALMVGAALERVLAATLAGTQRAGMDGAAIVADATWLLAVQRQEVVDERVQAATAGRQSDVASAGQYAQWAAQAATPAGALEDLGAGSAGPAPARPDPAKLRRLQDEIRDRKAQVKRTIADAQRQSGLWDSKRAQADKLGNMDMAKNAERNADMERARMHSALAELASLDQEEKGLADAARAAASAPPPPRQDDFTESPSHESARRSGTSRPSVDEELDRLRSQAGGTKPASSAAPRSAKTSKKAKKKAAVDDELAALKRKMAQKRK